jgi:hypothetical protein
MKKALILLIWVVIIVGVFVLAKDNSQSSKHQQVQPSPTPQAMSHSSGMMVENNSIYVSGQGESNALTVSMVTIVESGYVVIHADTNGQPGSVLGYSKLLPAGTHNNVPIRLSRKTVKGEIIYAMLHKDNGDKTYSSVDEPIKGSDGESMMMIVHVDETEETSPDAVSM